MKVNEVMANIVQIVGREDSLQTVAGKIKDHDVGCILVGSKIKLDGIITDRDIVCRGVATGIPLDRLTAADVMTPDPVSCRIGDTINQAAFIMEKHKVRRLPVLDNESLLAGIVSLGDVSRHVRHQLAGELIDEVSKPAHRDITPAA